MQNLKLAEQYLAETLAILKKQNILEIILFGSMISQNFTENSDIDLLIILDVDEIPETYEEKMKLKLELRKSIRHINRKIAIDMLVYTKKEYEVIINEKAVFLEEIINTGKKIYEKAS